MSKARTLNPYDMEARIHDLEENGGGSSTGQKAYGTGVNILANTKADPYIAPSDGVVRMSCNYSTSSFVALYSGETLIASCGGLSGNANGAATVPVLKGEALGILSAGSDLAATFIPYVAAT